MSSKPISQREARRMRKELDWLKRRDSSRLARWSSSYPGGAHIHSEDVTPIGLGKIATAHVLDCVVVVKIDGQNLNYYAIRDKP